MYAESLQSCLTLCDPMNCSPPGSSVHGFLNNIGVGWHVLLQGIFLTQWSNPHLLGLLHWQVGSLPLASPGKPQGSDAHKQGDPRLVRTRRWMIQTLTYLTNNQSEKCPWAYHPLWTITIRPLTTPSRWEHSFEGICSLWPPLPGKAICCCCYCWVVSDSLQPHGLQHTRLPWLSLSLAAAAAAAKSLQSCLTLCDPIDSSPPGSPTSLGFSRQERWSGLPFPSLHYLLEFAQFHIHILCQPFSFCLQSFPVSGSFPMSQFFASGGQNIGVSALASVLPMNMQA